MSSFKVWKRDPDGEPGTLLLRTGTPPSAPDFGDDDVFNAGATPEDVAAFACDRTGIFGDVRVKNFDTGEWFTVTVEKNGKTRMW